MKGIADAIKKSHAIKVYVCNVMTQPGETTGYTASRHVQTILDHVGPGVIDYCIVNVQAVPELLGEKYAEQKAYPVEADIEAIEKMGIKVARERLISEADVVRHDSQKLSRAIVKLILKLKSSTERMKLLDYYLLGEKLKQR